MSGDITANDRQGNACSYARMSLSVGAVVVESSANLPGIDLSEEAAIAKHNAKFHPGSYLYIHCPSSRVCCPPSVQVNMSYSPDFD